MGANPISNVDPDGDLFFAIPSVSFGSGGFGIGLEVGIGIPGAASASVGGNYNFSHGSASWNVQGTFAGAYAGFGTHGGYAGFGFNHGGANIGFNINTNSGASFSLGIGGNQGSGSSGVGISLGESGLSWGGSITGTIYDEHLFPDLMLKRYVNELNKADAYAYNDPCPTCSPSELMALQLGFQSQGNGTWSDKHGYTIQAESGGFLAELTDKMFFGSLNTGRLAKTLRNLVRRGSGPRGVERVDIPKLDANGNPIFGQKPHIHLKDGRAYNLDGTWKHGSGSLPNRIMKWINQHRN